jgi:hypothetical protein
MSLFITGQAFPAAADFAAAKIAVFGASVAAAIVGVIGLWNAERERSDRDSRFEIRDWRLVRTPRHARHVAPALPIASRLSASRISNLNL